MTDAAIGSCRHTTIDDQTRANADPAFNLEASAAELVTEMGPPFRFVKVGSEGLEPDTPR
jgi:hypothetical protein